MDIGWNLSQCKVYFGHVYGGQVVIFSELLHYFQRMLYQATVRKYLEKPFQHSLAVRTFLVFYILERLHEFYLVLISVRFYYRLGPYLNHTFTRTYSFLQGCKKKKGNAWMDNMPFCILQIMSYCLWTIAISEYHGWQGINVHVAIHQVQYWQNIFLPTPTPRQKWCNSWYCSSSK